LGYIFVAGANGARLVRFYLDDPGRRRPPLRVDDRPPFDLAGSRGDGRARPFDLRRLTQGAHTLVAVIERRGRPAQVLRARFSLRQLYLSPSGSDGAVCSLLLPCRSLQRAYEVALPGQVVELAAGVYADTVLAGSKGVPGVVFRPAAGASVSLSGQLLVDADNVELRDLRLPSFDVRAESDGFTARNLDVGWFEVHGASNVRVLGGDVGPSYRPGDASPNVRISYGQDAQGNLNVLPRNLLIDGVSFHDFRRGTPDDHMECMFVIGADGLTIRNSRFLRCDIYSIFFTQAFWDAPGLVKTTTNVLLENNFFDESTNNGEYGQAYNAVRFSDWMDRFNNITVRYNSAKQDISFGDNPKTNVRFYGNVSPLGQCVAGIQYDHNVWQSAKARRCDPTDTVVVGKKDDVSRLGFVDPAALDLRLSADSPAIDRGNRNDYPATDILGRRRPRGPAPDAGAVEAR
jgi:hypothetical protein